MLNLMKTRTLCTCGQVLGNRTHSVVASYKPSMLVTGVRFPVCAFLCACIWSPCEADPLDGMLGLSAVMEPRLTIGPVA